MLGQALGLKDEEFEALQGDYRASALFDRREKAVLAWSEAMTLNTAKRDDAVWGELRSLFNDAEIVEIGVGGDPPLAVALDERVEEVLHRVRSVEAPDAIALLRQGQCDVFGAGVVLAVGGPGQVPEDVPAGLERVALDRHRLEPSEHTELTAPEGRVGIVERPPEGVAVSFQESALPHVEQPLDRGAIVLRASSGGRGDERRRAQQQRGGEARSSQAASFSISGE